MDIHHVARLEVLDADRVQPVVAQRGGDGILAEQLAAVATVESAGAAMVYRVTEASIRRALKSRGMRRHGFIRVAAPA